jgi:hypothetical protein
MTARADGELANIRSVSQAFAIAGTRMDTGDSQDSQLSQGGSPQTVIAPHDDKVAL